MGCWVAVLGRHPARRPLRSRWSKQWFGKAVCDHPVGHLCCLEAWASMEFSHLWVVKLVKVPACQFIGLRGVQWARRLVQSGVGVPFCGFGASALGLPGPQVWASSGVRWGCVVAEHSLPTIAGSLPRQPPQQKPVGLSKAAHASIFKRPVAQYVSMIKSAQAVLSENRRRGVADVILKVVVDARLCKWRREMLFVALQRVLSEVLVCVGLSGLGLAGAVWSAACPVLRVARGPLFAQGLRGI